jgi:hypothetical protein
MSYIGDAKLQRKGMASYLEAFLFKTIYFVSLSVFEPFWHKK